jgi:hypothetical protein
LARRIGRPFLEIKGPAHWGVAASFRSSELAAQLGRQAIELARRHGWSGEPVVAIDYPMLADSLIWQGELDEAERWLMEGDMRLSPRSSQRQKCCSSWFEVFSRSLEAINRASALGPLAPVPQRA